MGHEEEQQGADRKGGDAGRAEQGGVQSTPGTRPGRRQQEASLADPGGAEQAEAAGHQAVLDDQWYGDGDTTSEPGSEDQGGAGESQPHVQITTVSWDQRVARDGEHHHQPQPGTDALRRRQPVREERDHADGHRGARDDPACAALVGAPGSGSSQPRSRNISPGRRPALLWRGRRPEHESSSLGPPSSNERSQAHLGGRRGHHGRADREERGGCARRISRGASGRTRRARAHAAAWSPTGSTA